MSDTLATVLGAFISLFGATFFGIVLGRRMEQDARKEIELRIEKAQGHLEAVQKIADQMATEAAKAALSKPGGVDPGQVLAEGEALAKSEGITK